MKIGYLIVSHWSDAGDRHWYGTISMRGADGSSIMVQAERPLKRREADELNDDEDDDCFFYKTGDISGRFIYEAALEQAAMAQASKMGLDILFRGSPGWCDPMRVLGAPEPLRTMLTAIYNRCEEIGFWDRDFLAAEMYQLRDRWESLLKEAGATV